MTDSADATGLPGADSAPGAEHTETPESIADEIRHEIHLGHVQDDVSHVLEERLEEEGIDMRPEDVDELAEEIERDAST
ncbi:hypothetical protein [Arthrobacter sp. AD-310]